MPAETVKRGSYSIPDRCGYCGSATHDRRDCHRELKATGRWNQAEWDALQRLCELEHDCMRYGMHITECPMAVREYAKLGRTFTPINRHQILSEAK